MQFTALLTASIFAIAMAAPTPQLPTGLEGLGNAKPTGFPSLGGSGGLGGGLGGSFGGGLGGSGGLGGGLGGLGGGMGGGSGGKPDIKAIIEKVCISHLLKDLS